MTIIGLKVLFTAYRLRIKSGSPKVDISTYKKPMHKHLSGYKVFLTLTLSTFLMGILGCESNPYSETAAIKKVPVLTNSDDGTKKENVNDTLNLRAWSWYKQQKPPGSGLLNGDDISRATSDVLNQFGLRENSAQNPRYQILVKVSVAKRTLEMASDDPWGNDSWGGYGGGYGGGFGTGYGGGYRSGGRSGVIINIPVQNQTQSRWMISTELGLYDLAGTPLWHSKVDKTTSDEDPYEQYDDLEKNLNTLMQQMPLR